VNDPTFDIFAEDWAPMREPPSVFELDGTMAAAPVESDRWQPVTPAGPGLESGIAFVDGTRRVEMGLWQIDPVDGKTLRGLAGAYAVGATVCRRGVPAAFAGLRQSRLCIWAGGVSGDLGPVAGYHWKSYSVPGTDPNLPLEALQELMRASEMNLARELAALGWQVVLDGPLHNLRTIRTLMAGYAKTHHRQLFPDELHRMIPTLQLGQRSPLWALHDDRYTCYLRVGMPSGVGSPWCGIVRLEFPAFAGVGPALELADRLSYVLPTYAGRAHLDPRAPQNLQPVRALEQQMGRLFGPGRQANQAARSAVAHLQASRRRHVLPSSLDGAVIS
jgi:hypothetical protein